MSGWLIGLVLTAIGFAPNAGKSAEAPSGLGVFSSLCPLLLHLLVFVLVCRFALDESAHRAVRARAA